MTPVLPQSYRDVRSRAYIAREDLGMVAAFALLTYAACVLGIATRPIGLLAAFWPANAVALGLLVRVPRLSSPLGWLAMSAAFVAADLTFGATVGRTLLLTAGNIVSIAVGYMLFRRLDDGLRRLRQPASIPYLLGIAAVASAAAGCVGAAANPVLFNGPPLRGWFFWFATELVNYIAILPAILLVPLSREGLRKVFALPDHSFFAILPAVALLISAVAGVLLGGPAAIIFPAPAIIWCAVFYRAFITSLLTLGLSVWTLCAISFGYLEVHFDLHDQEVIISLRLGVALIALAPLAIASLMTARADLMRRLQTTNAALTAADQAKDKFLAMMSHELRTPLSGILGMTDLLVATGLSKQHKVLPPRCHGRRAVSWRCLTISWISRRSRPDIFRLKARLFCCRTSSMTSAIFSAGRRRKKASR